MSNVLVRQTVHIKLHGGVTHRLGIAIAAEVAARKGYAVEDMSTWRGAGEEPDLVIRKREKLGPGPQGWKVLRFRLEIIDTHDPVPEWDRKGGYDELYKIHVGGKDLNGILVACEMMIP